jgi:hypothetical protein
MSANYILYAEKMLEIQADGSLSFVFSSSHLGDSGGPTPIANMASLPVVLSTSDQPSMFVAQLLPPYSLSLVRRQGRDWPRRAT